MRKFYFLLFIISLLISFCTTEKNPLTRIEEPTEPKKGNLYVIVQDSVGRLPNIMVHLDGAVTDSALTDKDGIALFENIPNGNYVIFINAPGYKFHEETLSFFKDSEQITFLLSRTKGSLYVIVQDSTRRIYKIMVYISGVKDDSLLTDAGGIAWFKELPNGIYNISINDLGYEFQTQTVSFYEGSKIVNFLLKKKYCHFSGQVQDTTGTPIEKVQIFIYYYNRHDWSPTWGLKSQIETNNTGQFQSKLQWGYYKFVLKESVFFPLEKEIKINQIDYHHDFILEHLPAHDYHPLAVGNWWQYVYRREYRPLGSSTIDSASYKIEVIDKKYTEGKMEIVLQHEKSGVSKFYVYDSLYSVTPYQKTYTTTITVTSDSIISSLPIGIIYKYMKIGDIYTVPNEKFQVKSGGTFYWQGTNCPVVSIIYTNLYDGPVITRDFVENLGLVRYDSFQFHMSSTTKEKMNLYEANVVGGTEWP